MSRCLQCSLYLFFPLNFTHLFSPTLLLSFHLLFSSSCLSSLPSHSLLTSYLFILLFICCHVSAFLYFLLSSPLLLYPCIFASPHLSFLVLFLLISSHFISFSSLFFSSSHLVMSFLSSCIHSACLVSMFLVWCPLFAVVLISSHLISSHLISSHLISFSPALAYNLVSGLASSVLLISSCLSSCFLTFSLMLFFPVLASSLLITFCLFSHFVSVSSHSLLSFCLLLSPPPLILSSSCISSHLSSSL